MPAASRYTDLELAAAIRASHSWRGVLRQLGLLSTSAGSARAARRRADRLGLDHSHFTGQRRWTDGHLRSAVDGASSWTEVVNRLGLSSANGSMRATVKAHATRLGLTLAVPDQVMPSRAAGSGSTVDMRNLRRAGSMLAASWYTLCGYEVCWPLEPCRYDLLVGADGDFRRVQVKTTTHAVNGSWIVQLRNTRRRGAVVYTAEEVDDFFVIDGDLQYYLIPLEAVGGFGEIALRSYIRFRIARPPTAAVTDIRDQVS